MFSRKAVGRAIDRKAKATVVDVAFPMACLKSETHQGRVFRAEHGVHFTYWASARNADRFGRRFSIGTLGNRSDNAIIDSCLAKAHTEFLNRKEGAKVLRLTAELVDYIDTLHNNKHRHSSLDMLTPA